MATRAEPTATITVRIPESMREQFDILAKSTDRRVQYHAFEAMRRYIEAEKWQVDLIAERLRQADAGEITYASPERAAAVLTKYAAYDDGQ